MNNCHQLFNVKNTVLYHPYSVSRSFFYSFIFHILKWTSIHPPPIKKGPSKFIEEDIFKTSPQLINMNICSSIQQLKVINSQYLLPLLAPTCNEIDLSLTQICQFSTFFVISLMLLSSIFKLKLAFEQVFNSSRFPPAKLTYDL